MNKHNLINVVLLLIPLGLSYLVFYLYGFSFERSSELGNATIIAILMSIVPLIHISFDRGWK